MRILFAFAGGRGHLEPLLPIARCAQDSGHAVAITGRAALLPTIEGLGFHAFASGPDRTAPNERIPLREVSAEREDRILRDGYADRIARARASSSLALAADWGPDLLVCDEIDFGSMIAAERLEIPYASVLVIAAGSFVRTELISEPLNAVRAEHGLPPDPGLGMLSRFLVLSPFPPSFRDPAFPLPPTAHGFRQLTLESTGGEPPWPVRLPDAPTVYFTLGTVFNVESGDLFSRVLEGLRGLPVNVVATVGAGIDPAELGPLPDTVHVEQYIAQSDVLPPLQRGGLPRRSGSVTGALAHGLPLVVIPMGADQPLNAARCEALGVGQSLDAVRAAPEMVRETVAGVLFNPGYRTAAERLRDEIAALPEPGETVALLERLAAERR